MTFLQVVNIIKDTAFAQPNVNTVVREFLDLNREDTVYSAVVIQDRDGSRDRIVEQDWNTYTFHLGYVDRLTDDEKNRDDIFSTGINVINNIVASIRDKWDLGVNIIDRFSTFNQRFTAQCAGVYVVLAIQVPVSDCVDGESTDIYKKLSIDIINNGHYHYVPDGRPYGDIDIVVNVDNQKPEDHLVETISSNGSYHYSPEEGRVFGEAEITVDVHPSESLSETYTTNGIKTITGEFNGGTVNVDVHPSNKLVETITSNGTTNFSGEWKDAEITVSIPEEKPEESLEKTITSNGSYSYNPEEGRVFSDVYITVDVHPTESLSRTYRSNGNYDIIGEFNGGVVTVDVPSSQFVTETLNVSKNGTYTPSEGVDGYSQVVVDVPISGWDQKSFTEGTIEIINLDNSASFVVSSAFDGNKTIQTVNLPYATIVRNYAFRSCTSLTQVSLPMCSYIATYAFYGCTSLTQVSLPMCSYIGIRAFQSCISLTQVSLPMCSYIGTSAFYTCRNISQVSLPMCSYIGSNAFWQCYALAQVSLPMCSYIGSNAFRGCGLLSIITLGYSNICSLNASSTFYNTQITSSTGSIYVPTSLVDSYKSATNWSYFSTQIFPIPE